jgi:hypothetical protein
VAHHNGDLIRQLYEPEVRGDMEGSLGFPTEDPR